MVESVGWSESPNRTNEYKERIQRACPFVARHTGERLTYEYLCGSIEKFPAGDAMCDLLKTSGFSSATSEPLSFGIASLYHARK